MINNSSLRINVTTLGDNNISGFLLRVYNNNNNNNNNNNIIIIIIIIYAHGHYILS